LAVMMTASTFTECIASFNDLKHFFAGAFSSC